MKGIRENLQQLRSQLPPQVTLVAVSKTKSVEEIKEAYEAGQRDFGENYVQELEKKQAELPKDIRWHFIGHLQSNKVKYMAPFVHLIHGIDSLKLLQEVNKQAEKCGRVIDCLLQVHIASEETKFGFDAAEIDQVLSSPEFASLKNVNVKGLMGMASNTDDQDMIRREFRTLTSIQKKHPLLKNLSFGMSSDYRIAVEEGSTLVRIGSLIFGERNYNR